MEEKYYKDKKVFITGGTGSWGNELVKQLLQREVKSIVVYSRGEHKQVEMKRRFQDDRIIYKIGDVRDLRRLTMTMRDVDYVFHLAALKHVPVCEENPSEAVETNILGTQNIIEAAIENSVEKVIDISTDKAVDPFNLYGVTKSCGEKLIVNANDYSNKTRFVCIRGGNVLGTNGSVVPLFIDQIRRLNHVTITDNRMTRFLMRVQEAIGLVLFATENSEGGEIFVMKMPACKIVDLASVLIENFGNESTKTKNIGIRPGEKLYEVLVSRYEIDRTYDLDKYFVILPEGLSTKSLKYKNVKKISDQFDEYNSNNCAILDEKGIYSLLKEDGWFDRSDEKSGLKLLQSLDKKTLENYFKTERWIK